MARGTTYKRCRDHGTTGTPARGKKPAVPACRCKPPSGTWTWRAEGMPDPATGKRTQPSSGGFPTRQDAQEALAAYLSETGGGRSAYDRQTTVATWLRRWISLGTGPRGPWEPVTEAKYRSHVEDYLIPHLGKLRLRDLRHYHVDAMCAELGRTREVSRVRITSARDCAGKELDADGRCTSCGRKVRRKAGGGLLAHKVLVGLGGSVSPTRSPSTVDSVRRTLRSALESARRRDLIAVNPAAGEVESIGTVPRRPVTMWQPTQLARFLAAVAGDPDGDLWVVAAWTGLRREELLGLREDACELEPADPGLDRYPGVWIRQRCVGTAGLWPCQECGGEHRTRQLRPDGKSEHSARWVPLSESARLALLCRLALNEQDRQRWGKAYSDHGLVWAERLGGPRCPNDLTKRHAALVAGLGLPKVRLHDMRHGMGSMIIGAGGSMEHAAQMLGHGSESTTRGIYVHQMRGPLYASVQAMEALLERAWMQSSAHDVHTGPSGEVAPGMENVG